MVPEQLRPRWRELPAAAWLAAGRFQPAALRRPILHRLAQAAAWPVLLQVLLAAHAEGALAVWRARALIIVQQRPRPTRAARLRAMFAGLAGLPVTVAALLAPGTTVLLAGASLAQPGQPGQELPAVLVLTGFALYAVQFALTIAGVVPALTSGALRDRRHARAWSRRTFRRVAEATTLAADPADDRAATVLVRILLRTADRRGLPVIAQPADTQLAERYRLLGFLPIPGAGRALYRPPGGRPASSNRQTRARETHQRLGDASASTASPVSRRSDR